MSIWLKKWPVKTLEEVQRRKALLIARSATQRVELFQIFDRLERPVNIAGQVIFFLKKPFVLTGLAALLLKKKRRKGLAKLPGLLWRGWQVFSMFRQPRV